MPESESSLLQKHNSMSATEIFLVSDIKCLSQNMRFRADTCNICRRGGNTHATFSRPRYISITHNTGHGLRLPYKRDRGKGEIPRCLRPKTPRKSLDFFTGKTFRRTDMPSQKYSKTLLSFQIEHA